MASIFWRIEGVRGRGVCSVTCETGVSTGFRSVGDLGDIARGESERFGDVARRGSVRWGLDGVGREGKVVVAIVRDENDDA